MNCQSSFVQDAEGIAFEAWTADAEHRATSRNHSLADGGADGRPPSTYVAYSVTRWEASSDALRVIEMVSMTWYCLWVKTLYDSREIKPAFMKVVMFSSVEDGDLIFGLLLNCMTFYYWEPYLF